MSTLEVIKDSLEHIEAGFQRLDTKNRELSDEILQLKQRGAVQHSDFMPATKSLGNVIADELAKNMESLERNRTMRLSVKSSVLSSQVGNVASQGPVQRPNAVATALVSAIPTRSLGGISSLRYSRMTEGGTLLGNLVQNGEGAAKQQVQPTFAPITQNAITVAGWASLSEQALKTQGELASVIDSHLSNMVLRGLDNTLIDGTAVAAWPFEGLEALATDYTSEVYTLLHDAIVEAAAGMRAMGFEPDIVCINPMTFLDIALKKDSTGQYLTGAYMGELPAMLHGMRVMFSASVAAGKALVIDSRFTELLISDEFNVVFAYQSDDFVKNLVTARAEVAVIPVVRDLNAMLLVAPKP